MPNWRWQFMWGLAFAIYCGCKWITWRGTARLLSKLDIGYLTAWPGLDAFTFFDSRAAVRPTAREWSFAWFKLAVGLVILYEAARWLPADDPYLVGWAGMIGIVLALHFGLFHLLSCGWREVGVDARPLMNWPIRSVGLGDFWGRRWNTAFRDLTHRYLFRPLSSRFGPRRALVAGFAFSGLVHDAVISVPSQGGYGGPTIFFLLQAAGILAERSRPGRKLGLGAGWRGRLFALVMLVIPATLLFHRPFVERVIVPFLRSIGAIR